VLPKGNASRIKYTLSTLGDGQDDPASHDLPGTMNPTRRALVSPQRLKFMSMAAGVARAARKTCLHIITIGICPIDWRSLCYACEGHWSCGRGKEERKERKAKERFESLQRRAALNENQGVTLEKGELREILYSVGPLARIYTGTSSVPDGFLLCLEVSRNCIPQRNPDLLEGGFIT
jgi:hypothetical protein